MSLTLGRHHGKNVYLLKNTGIIFDNISVTPSYQLSTVVTFSLAKAEMKTEGGKSQERKAGSKNLVQDV